MKLQTTCHHPESTSPFFSSDEERSHAWAQFNKTLHHPDYGFFSLNNEKHLLESCEKTFEKFKHKKNFVQVGIGGSSLGPEMLVHALGHGERRFEFICNIDPDKISDQLRHLTPDETLFYFVSKSGGTAETMAGFAIVSHWLEEQQISQTDYHQHMVFATDPVKSDMLDLGRELGVDCLAVPSNVGGRFSVLSPVGLFPALFAGIDAGKLLVGAESVKEIILHADLEKNSFCECAEFIMTLFKQGVSQTVMMPYSSKLKEFSAWFVQLWAESLGKKKNVRGEVVNTGLTPIASYGATDQHSQVQLFMEGPFDKLLLFIEVENFNNDFKLSNNFSTPSLKKLSPFSLVNLMQAELAGTRKALAEQGKPSIHLKIEYLDAEHLGAMILYFEALTAFVGQLLEVDPFDQPGVEAGKKYAFEWLASL